MCVIIDREPMVTIPLDKLEIACRINPHGYGLAYVSGKNLKFEHNPKNTNDPQEVFDRLEALKNKRVFLHLRYATVGDVNRENCHPFVTLTRRVHEIGVGFMHNGTLGMYRPTGELEKAGWSDTKNFNEHFVKPLAERCVGWGSSVSPLTDSMFLRLVTKEIGGTSVCLFFDSEGNVVRVNEQSGKQFEGWWASNSYSFTETHHRANPTVWDNWPASSPLGRGRYFDTLPGAKVYNPDIPRSKTSWEIELEKYDQTDKEEEHRLALLREARHVPYVVKRDQTLNLKQHLATVKLDTPENCMANALLKLDLSRPKIVDELEIDHITDLLKLTEESWYLLCKSCPAAMTEVFLALCGELDIQRKTNRALERQVKGEK